MIQIIGFVPIDTARDLLLNVLICRDLFPPCLEGSPTCAVGVVREVTKEELL